MKKGLYMKKREDTGCSFLWVNKIRVKSMYNCTVLRSISWFNKVVMQMLPITEEGWGEYPRDISVLFL